MANPTVQVSTRGTITIPKPLRDAYDLKPGDTLALLDLGSVLVLDLQRPEPHGTEDQTGRATDSPGLDGPQDRRRSRAREP